MRPFLALILTVACATAPRSHNVERSGVINAPMDATWSAVISLFGERGWPIATIDRSSGLIATDWLRMPAETADCGSAPLVTRSALRGRFNLIVTVIDDVTTRLTVNTKFQQARELMGTARVVDCVSTGSVEESIRSRVAARAAH